MKLLLCSDLHLVDSPQEEYRWEFFEETLPKLVKQYEVEDVWCLGDLTDRRDRHSGNLLNRLVKGTLQLPSFNCLMGNHDAPINGPSYWAFLSSTYQKSNYYTFPSFQPPNMLVLPFSSNPEKEWAEAKVLGFPLKLTDYEVIFMHQTITGSLIEGNRKIEEGHKLPPLPQGIPIYSGDIHRPQQVGPITYIGTPYPTRFGEDWPGRVLILNSNDFSKYQEVQVDSIKRSIIDLNPANFEEQLKKTVYTFKKGDQLRIRYHLSTSSMSNWAEDENLIRTKIASTGAELLSVEVLLSEEVSMSEKTVPTNNLEELSMEETLRLFSKEEGLSPELVEVGLSILNKTKV